MTDRKFKESMAELWLLMHELDMIDLRMYCRVCVGSLAPLASTANDTNNVEDVWAIHHYR